ncbi:Heat shock 70 kDa protein 1-like [Rhizophlyctis rosea]|nr:Heat shock 70 kDa protein 1-like [Rhizophlyctis rosea]
MQTAGKPDSGRYCGHFLWIGQYGLQQTAAQHVENLQNYLSATATNLVDGATGLVVGAVSAAKNMLFAPFTPVKETPKRPAPGPSSPEERKMARNLHVELQASNENWRASVFEAGTTKVIKMRNGMRSMSGIFTRKENIYDGTRVVGQKSYHLAGVIGMLGRKQNDPIMSHIAKMVTCSIVSDNNGHAAYKCGNTIITPMDIATTLLKTLLKEIQIVEGGTVNEITFSVPMYSFDSSDTTKTVVVADVGVLEFELTGVQVDSRGLPTIQFVVVGDGWGGLAISERMTDFYLAEFERGFDVGYKWTENYEGSRQQLWSEVDSGMLSLRGGGNADIKIEKFIKHPDRKHTAFTTRLTTRAVENACDDLLRAPLEHIQALLLQNTLDQTSIHTVLFAGAPCFLSGYYKSFEQFLKRRDLKSSVHVDEASIIGAALIASDHTHIINPTTIPAPQHSQTSPPKYPPARRDTGQPVSGVYKAWEQISFGRLWFLDHRRAYFKSPPGTKDEDKEHASEKTYIQGLLDNCVQPGVGKLKVLTYEHGAREAVRADQAEEAKGMDTRSVTSLLRQDVGGLKL